jgi:peptide chain release factor subunit 1
MLYSEVKIVHLNKEQESDRSFFTDSATGVDYEVQDKLPLLEWLAENYKSFGANVLSPGCFILF